MPLNFDSEGAMRLNKEENKTPSDILVKTQTQFRSLNSVHAGCLCKVKEMLTGLKFGF